MSNKNAYEIRLNVLEMAHQDEMTKFHEKMQLLRLEEEKDPTKQMLTETEVDGMFPKTKNILQRAEELYSFVSA
jgi:hypothetical protein